jgi:SAM-dependent methyltransferase
MRRQIYLHIGFPKTGTTSIQTWLTEHAPALAAHGVLYPAHGRDGQEYQYGHHRLARSLVERPLSELTVTWPDMARLRDEMETSPAQTIVISSEDFSMRLQQPEVDLLAQHLADFDVRIVCYVRRQDEFIISLWSTAVAYYGEADPLSCYLDHSRLDYAGTISPWARAFGPGAILLRVFERSQLVGGDAVEDFLSVCGIVDSVGFTPLDHTHHNRRLPAHISLIQAYLNAHQIDRGTITRAGALSSMLDHGETGTPLLGRADRMALLARHDAGNRSLAQTYLGRSDGRLFYDLTIPDDGASSAEVNADTHSGVASAIARLVDDTYVAVTAGNHLPDTGTCRDLPESFRSMSDDAWLETLLATTTKPIVNGFCFPRFPDPSIQVAFVGTESEMAIREAFNFYLVSDGYSRALGMPLTLDRNFLDFGVGWGRFPRIFWKDVRASNLYGCDVDPDALALCRKTGVPGTFDRLYPRGRLPYPDRHFDGGIAYSVFTHLSEDAHTHWMCELARVMRPGAVFCMTLEPRRFAEFIEQIPDKPLTDWHIGLKRFAGEGNRLRAEFDAGQLAYLPTGGGMHRQASEYGDAIVPPDFIEREWGHAFALRAYIDDPSRYWQAVAVMQRI